MKNSNIKNNTYAADIAINEQITSLVMIPRTIMASSTIVFSFLLLFSSL